MRGTATLRTDPAATPRCAMILRSLAKTPFVLIHATPIGAFALLGQLLFAAGATAVPILLGLSASGKTLVFGPLLTVLAGAVCIALSLLRVLKLGRVTG